MIKRIFYIIIAITLLGCSSKNSKEYASVDEMVKETKTKVDFISSDDLKAVLDAHKHVYLIDCRESEEFDSACIKDAINIPRGVIEGSISEKAPKHRQTVIIYCNNGDRSSLAAAILPHLKYSDVKVLEGGFDDWKTKYPDMIEIHPVRGDSQVKAPAKPSGGCGG